MPSLTINDNVLLYGPPVAIIGTIIIVELVGISRIRRFVIHLVQLCAILSLVWSSAIGATVGFSWGHFLQEAYLSKFNPPDPKVVEVYAGILSAVIGGFLFFVIAAIPFSLILLLIDISTNTRRLAQVQINNTLDEQAPRAIQRGRLTRIEMRIIIVLLLFIFAIVGIFLSWPS